jgi:hypothetical protein
VLELLKSHLCFVVVVPMLSNLWSLKIKLIKPIATIN